MGIPSKCTAYITPCALPLCLQTQSHFYMMHSAIQSQYGYQIGAAAYEDVKDLPTQLTGFQAYNLAYHTALNNINPKKTAG